MDSFFSKPSDHNKIPMKETKASLSNDIFPGDIMMDILSRLPAKFLLKFTCVSPSWYNLVFDPPFITMQLHRSSKNPKAKLMLIDDKSCVYSLDCQKPDNKPVQLHPPNHWKFNKVVGSCNGLLCMESSSYIGRFKKLNRDLYIWNPTTNVCKKLPKLEDANHSRLYGFYCVNPTVKDYRVLVLSHIRHNNKLEVAIYSNNSWRQLASLPCYYYHMPYHVGVLVGGFLYWRLPTKDPLMISFDTVHEKFEEVELPCEVPVTNSYTRPEPELLNLGEFKGKLCVLYRRYKNFELWVTKNHVDKSSWKMLVTGFMFWDNRMPMKCITKKVFIFLKKIGYGGGSELLLYEPNEKGRREIFCSQIIYQVASYVESIESVYIE